MTIHLTFECRKRYLMDQMFGNSQCFLSRGSSATSKKHQTVIHSEHPGRVLDPKGKPKRRLRAVQKTGETNIHPSGVPRKHLLLDTFTTLVDSRWRYTISIFTAGFSASWTAFAVGWWLLALFHGDLEDAHLPPNQAAANWTPCVTDIHGFTSCLLFSVETQHTTGYGEKRPTERCPDAILLMCLQNIAGLVIEAFLVGVVFAKATRPRMRAQTVRFSREAVVCVREGVLCLAFRVGDMRRKSSLIATKLTAKLIRQRITTEGEHLPNHLSNLPLTVDECGGDSPLMWPSTVIHQIDENSPLYHLSAADLPGEDLEVVVTLEGTVESTDQKMRARSSYLAEEVLWGRRFVPVVEVDEGGCGYRVEYKKFDETVLVEGMVMCSAAEMGSKGQGKGV